MFFLGGAGRVCRGCHERLGAIFAIGRTKKEEQHMSKIFLGLSFVGAGIALLVLQMTTQWAASFPFAPLCAGTLLGAGGILVVWYIDEHIAVNQTPRVSGK
jgi:peptidoglycan/LPS O-acetylase OafA/YrhL